MALTAKQCTTFFVFADEIDDTETAEWFRKAINGHLNTNMSYCEMLEFCQNHIDECYLLDLRLSNRGMKAMRAKKAKAVSQMSDDNLSAYARKLAKDKGVGIPITSKSNTATAKLQDIQNYTAPPESHVYQKQLHGFLLKDTISENEDLFEALEPLISEFRRDRNGCETKAERKFLIAYKATLLRCGHFNEGFKKGAYSLEPQKEIEGSIAKVKPYRADFLNERTKVIVEINGSVHDTDERRKYDRNRTRELFNLGYLVLNFTNDEIEQNAYKCAREVMTAIEKQLKGAKQ